MFLDWEGHATYFKNMNILSGCKKISWKVLTKEVAQNLNQDFNTIYVSYKTCSKVTSFNVNSNEELNYINRSLHNDIDILV